MQKVKAEIFTQIEDGKVTPYLKVCIPVSVWERLMKQTDAPKTAKARRRGNTK